MTNIKKQLKITKLFRKGASRPRVPEDCDEIAEEVRQLEEKLREKQNELFQIQRSKCKQKASPPKKNEEIFVRPQKIILSNLVDNLKRELQLMSMLTGVEVQSYEVGGHCCVVFHLQHDSKSEIKHGLRIDLHSENNVISKSSLPLGFNIKGVMEHFDNIMMPECLQAIRNGLVAYYNRLQQFEDLKKLVNVEAELFKLLDASHIEITFDIQSNMEDDEEHIHVTLILDYRVYDIRPKNFSFNEKELPEGVSDTLREQCAIFKRKPLHKAFREAFIDGIRSYKLVQRLGVRSAIPPTRHKRFRPNKQNYNNDDTFLPEDCSDQGENDDENDE